MNSVKQITVNGQPCSLEGVAPRVMLADYIRDRLDLTGTHLGCEHGICGACTVNIDGHAARSCITLAHACAGAKVTTIEGYDQEVLMAQLRRAFTEEHALQCGFCTPGMLIAARDLILRHPDANEHVVRLEMSGNLCRCTGYMGIVNAILRVLRERRASLASGDVCAAAGLGPVGSHGIALNNAVQTAVPGSLPVKAESSSAARQPSVGMGRKATGPLTTIDQSFTVDFPLAQVWTFFAKLDVVGRCLPGLSLEVSPGSSSLGILLKVRVGPISAEFDGTAEVQQDEATHSGHIVGDARDRRSGTNAHGDIRYRLTPVNGGGSTRVDIDLGYVLAGPLAQFSRGSIAKDIAKKLTEAFAENLRHRLLHGEDAQPPSGGQSQELNASGLIWSVIMGRIKGFFARLFGRAG